MRKWSNFDEISNITISLFFSLKIHFNLFSGFNPDEPPQPTSSDDSEITIPPREDSCSKSERSFTSEITVEELRLHDNEEQYKTKFQNQDTPTTSMESQESNSNSQNTNSSSNKTSSDSNSNSDKSPKNKTSEVFFQNKMRKK